MANRLVNSISVGEHADAHYMRDAMLLELEVQVSLGNPLCAQCSAIYVVVLRNEVWVPSPPQLPAAKICASSRELDL